MCEYLYNGCPKCKADTDEIVFQTTGYVSVEYEIDSCGDPQGEAQWEGEPDISGSDSQLYCRSCGHEGFELEVDIEPDDCECRECEPVEDCDDLITLVRRTQDAARPVVPWPYDTPPEILALIQRRSLSEIPIRRERGEEVIRWLTTHSGWEDLFMLQGRRPKRHCLQFQVPEQPKQLEVAA